MCLDRIYESFALVVEDDVSAMLINLFVYSSIAPNFVDLEAVNMKKIFNNLKPPPNPRLLVILNAFHLFRLAVVCHHVR